MLHVAPVHRLHRRSPFARTPRRRLRRVVRCTFGPVPFAMPALAGESVRAQPPLALAAALDELDYGIVLLFDGMRVVHVNDAARWSSSTSCDTRCSCSAASCAPSLARDVAPPHEAVNGRRAAAASRSSLTLGKDGRARQRLGDAARSRRRRPARRPRRRSASAASASRSRCRGSRAAAGLTCAETRVLDRPVRRHRRRRRAAEELGVAISTIRSQIGSMRQKTGAESIRALVRQVAVPATGAERAAPQRDRARVSGWFPRRCNSRALTLRGHAVSALLAG